MDESQLFKVPSIKFLSKKTIQSPNNTKVGTMKNEKMELKNEIKTELGYIGKKHVLDNKKESNTNKVGKEKKQTDIRDALRQKTPTISTNITEINTSTELKKERLNFSCITADDLFSSPKIRELERKNQDPYFRMKNDLDPPLWIRHMPDKKVDLIDSDSYINALDSFLGDLKKPNQHWQNTVAKGFVVSGEPGVGKTALVRAMILEKGYEPWFLSYDDWESLKVTKSVKGKEVSRVDAKKTFYKTFSYFVSEHVYREFQQIQQPNPNKVRKVFILDQADTYLTNEDLSFMIDSEFRLNENFRGIFQLIIQTKVGKDRVQLKVDKNPKTKFKEEIITKSDLSNDIKQSFSVPVIFILDSIRSNIGMMLKKAALKNVGKDQFLFMHIECKPPSEDQIFSKLKIILNKEDIVVSKPIFLRTIASQVKGNLFKAIQMLDIILTHDRVSLSSDDPQSFTHLLNWIYNFNDTNKGIFDFIKNNEIKQSSSLSSSSSFSPSISSSHTKPPVLNDITLQNSIDQQINVEKSTQNCSRKEIFDKNQKESRDKKLQKFQHIMIEDRVNMMGLKNEEKNNFFQLLQKLQSSESVLSLSIMLEHCMNYDYFLLLIETQFLKVWSTADRSISSFNPNTFRPSNHWNLIYRPEKDKITPYYTSFLSCFSEYFAQRSESNQIGILDSTEYILRKEATNYFLVYSFGLLFGLLPLPKNPFFSERLFERPKFLFSNLTKLSPIDEKIQSKDLFIPSKLDLDFSKTELFTPSEIQSLSYNNNNSNGSIIHHPSNNVLNILENKKKEKEEYIIMKPKFAQMLNISFEDQKNLWNKEKNQTSYKSNLLEIQHSFKTRFHFFDPKEIEYLLIICEHEYEIILNFYKNYAYWTSETLHEKSKSIDSRFQEIENDPYVNDEEWYLIKQFIQTQEDAHRKKYYQSSFQFTTAKNNTMNRIQKMDQKKQKTLNLNDVNRDPDFHFKAHTTLHKYLAILYHYGLDTKNYQVYLKTIPNKNAYPNSIIYQLFEKLYSYFNEVGFSIITDHRASRFFSDPLDDDDIQENFEDF